MSTFDLTILPPWEQLFKRVLWAQLGDLQQKQDCHTDPAWQEKMIETELRVARLQPYRDIAFFHHLLLEKEEI